MSATEAEALAFADHVLACGGSYAMFTRDGAVIVRCTKCQREIVLVTEEGGMNARTIRALTGRVERLERFINPTASVVAEEVEE